MFTGIIETTGNVIDVQRSGNACVMGIEPREKAFKARTGASVSVDGVCLTVEKTKGSALYFTAVRETLDRTTLVTSRPGIQVNLERAMEAGGRFDGHFVLGHVDGIAEITSLKVEGQDRRCVFKPPASCVSLLAEKGSVAIDGVSLTVAAVHGGEIEIALIPATLKATTLGRKKVGDTVNLECDVIARYLERIVRQDAVSDGRNRSGKTLYEALERHGF